MLRKEAEKRIFKKILDDTLKPFFIQNGFKYSKGNFIRPFNDFRQEITIYAHDNYGPIVYNQKHEHIQMNFVMYFRCYHPGFLDWFRDHFTFHMDAWSANVVHGFRFYVPFDEHWLTEFDFFNPNKSQFFKQFVSQSLRPHNDSDQYIPEFECMIPPFELMALYNKADFGHLFEKAATLSCFEKVFEPLPFSFAHFAHYLFLNDLDAARAQLQANYAHWTTDYQQEVNEYDKTWKLENIRKLCEQGKKWLDIDLPLPGVKKTATTYLNKDFSIPPNAIQYKELFSIQKPAKALRYFTVNDRGDLLLLHQTSVPEVVIMDKNGKILSEKRLVYDPGLEIHSEIYIGYLPEQASFFVNNYLITKDLEYIELPLPYPGKLSHKDKVNGNFSFPIIYYPAADQLVTAIGFGQHFKKVICKVLFYSADYQLVKQLDFEDTVVDIIPEKQWIMTCKFTERYQIFDFDGQLIHDLPCRNARSAFNWANHRFSPDYRYLLTYFYYIKSELFDLETGKSAPLWLHPTHLKGYKDQFTGVAHAFSMTQAVFTKNGKYIVGYGTQGKIACWKAPKWQRAELIPGQDFLNRMPEARFFEIGQERFFVNNARYLEDGAVNYSEYANHPNHLQLLQDGALICFVLKNDLLIWDNEMNYIGMTEGIGNFREYGKYAVSFSYEEQELTLYAVEADGNR